MNSFLYFLILFLFHLPYLYAQSEVDLVKRGNVYSAQGQYSLAIEDYTHAIYIDPYFAKAYDNRGVVYAKINRISDAIADFTMAIATNPRDAEAYNNRGNAYTKLEDFTKAILDYTQAIKFKPDYIKAYNSRGMVFFYIKKYTEAWNDIKKVQSLGGHVDRVFMEKLNKVANQ